MPYDLCPDAPQRIAVIGGGISGLAAAWVLSSYHQVTLYEADPRFGGHARTLMAGKNGDRPVDTGFIVFNYVNYPHLTALFRDLDVPVKRSDMSFGVSLGDGALEYALRSGNAMFGQRRNIGNPAFWGMIRDILRFNSKAFAAVAGQPDISIKALLDHLGIGLSFREHYLYPICSAIWSTPRTGIGDFPAEALIRFMRNHGLMQARGRHGWWTVDGGSMEYVRRLTTALRQRGVTLHAGAPVAAVTRGPIGVSLRAQRGVEAIYDQIIFACHPDQALRVLTDPRPDESVALRSVRFQDNRAVLHADPAVMPKRRRCWSSWVYREGPSPVAADRAGVGVTYWMNRLQSIDESDPLFVSLNPAENVDPRLVYDEHVFRHPVFDLAALRAQREISQMQGRDGTWFAGAWLRHGFHEDGFASSMRISRVLAPKRMLVDRAA
ncbi:FAD-dependent oxidoreductase [Paracoccus sp. (in: a-proteobacteria)]|uniref:NAD(P)/FAD-dependent oxidoreductase n=1 Tax=Paracoccus sp. TaxID=267 RepID=UPI00289BB18B|nr:FAD-dependent oxidoreductase [Paracoccus sp. (in: a-proteobacteria)]